MGSLLKYVWPVLIAVYIISPFDAHPLFLDDIIAAGLLFYIMFKNTGRKAGHRRYDEYRRQSGSSGQTGESTAPGPLTLEEAFSVLGVGPGSTMDEVTRAYKEKMVKSHPDKVSHLSKELQEKAEEITVKLNEAYDVVKRYKKR